MKISVPESFRSYCGDEAVSRAVDRLIEESGKSGRRKEAFELPPDLAWKDMRSFHRAVLSACQVQCEYGIFVIDLWDAVWKPTLEEFEERMPLERLSISESQRRSEWRVDPSAVWYHGFNRCFMLPADATLVTGTYAGTGTVKLWIEYRSADGSTADSLALGDGWASAEGNFGRSSEGVHWSDEGRVDLNCLREVARDALRAVVAKSP